MTWIIDTHLHLYPGYDAGRAIDALWAGLSRMKVLRNGCEVCLAGVLAERFDCHFMDDLLSGRVGLPREWVAERGEEPGCVCLRRRDGGELWLFGGRQVVTAERIEILALTGTGPFVDRRSAVETIDAVLADGGIPVLSWAPGKWFFKRGRVIQSLLDRYRPGQLCVGDTTLRPVFWPEPALMKHAVSAGFRCLAGSDPLPVPGEEGQLGRYASVLDGGFDVRMPVTALRHVLKQTGPGAVNVGSRAGACEWLGRLAGNERARRAAKP